MKGRHMGPENEPPAGGPHRTAGFAGRLDAAAARDYLIGLKEDGTGLGVLDVEALERVIALLEG